MKLKNCIYILFFVFTISSAQSTFKKGMYTSWESLQKNTPDVELNSKVLYKKVTNNKQKLEPHRIAVIKSNSEKRILAFSNGNELFFNARQPELKNKPFFNYVTLYGDRYGIYSSLFAIGINKNLGVGNFPMHCNVKGIELVDFKKGAITKILNTNDLKSLLVNDPELLKRFKKESKKNQKIKVYLLEYLLRNS